MKFRGMLPEQYVTVDCDDPFTAQNAAFALIVSRLSPSEIAVTEARPGDLMWAEEIEMGEQHG